MPKSCLGNFINKSRGSEKEILWGSFQFCIWMLKEVFHSVLLWCKLVKKGEYSALLWSLTSYLSWCELQFINCVWFCQVHEGCLPHDKNDSEKALHNLQLTSAWIRSWKTRAEHYILLHDKRYFLVLSDFIRLHIQSPWLCLWSFLPMHNGPLGPVHVWKMPFRLIFLWTVNH